MYLEFGSSAEFNPPRIKMTKELRKFPEIQQILYFLFILFRNSYLVFKNFYNFNRTAAINQNISDHESRANIPANSRPTKTSLLKPDQAGALFACLYHRVDRHCPLQTAALYLISSVKSHQMRFLTIFLSWRRCTRSRVVKRAIVHAVNASGKLNDR